MSSVGAARVIVDELIRAGVRDVVLSPGSRNAPLSYALHAAEQRGRLRLHVRIDERTAAFLALGLAKASGVPTPMICTSGTAAANLHPAMLEASHSGIPLVALTADRPADLFGSGANQTTDQAGMFGAASRWSVTLSGDLREAALRSAIDRALGWSLGVDPGPVHINLGLAEPLIPTAAEIAAAEIATGDGATGDGATGDGAVGGRPGGGPWTDIAPLAGAWSAPFAGGPAAAPARSHGLSLTARTVLVAGDAPAELGAAAAGFAAAHRLPIISEPSSGAWGIAVPAAPLLLSAPWLAAHRPDQAIVVGHPTLSRPVRQLLSDPSVATVAISDGPRWADASLQVRSVHPAAALLGASVHGDRPGAGWEDAWSHAGAAADATLDALLSRDDAWPTSLAAAREVVAALPGGTLLFLGSSSAVRDVEIAGAPRSDLLIMANRGLAGIDGTLSTAMGAALAGGRPGCLLVGDLTFLHDANALIGAPGEARPDLTIVVLNDDGGGIFSLLEQGDQQDDAAFERVFGTPHGVDLAALCAATGTPHTLVASRAELRDACRRQPEGLRVVELRTERGAARGMHARAAAAVARAL